MDKIWEQRAHYGHFFFRIPHGESAADVYDRIASFNETLFRQFSLDSFPNVLVLVTHGIWARVFLMKWFRWTYEEFETLRNIPHCQYLVMKQQPDGKYSLKTPLKTWDDLADSDVDEELRKEVSQEVKFNTQGKINDPDDLDIASILKAQRAAINESRIKDQEIKQAYKDSMDKMTKYKQNDQSVPQSTDDLGSASQSN